MSWCMQLLFLLPPLLADRFNGGPISPQLALIKGTTYTFNVRSPGSGARSPAAAARHACTPARILPSGDNDVAPLPHHW